MPLPDKRTKGKDCPKIVNPKMGIGIDIVICRQHRLEEIFFKKVLLIGIFSCHLPRMWVLNKKKYREHSGRQIMRSEVSWSRS